MGGQRAGGARTHGGLGRSVLVIAEDPELAVALRDRLDRAYVTVLDIRPSEADEAIRDRHACPWMVVGTVRQITDEALRALARRPVLLLWLGTAPAQLPRHARSLLRYSEVAAALEEAIAADVGGMRLAPGCGLQMPDGCHAADDALEVLVGGHPHPVYAEARHFRAVGTTLRTHGVAFSLARTASAGASLVTTA